MKPVTAAVIDIGSNSIRYLQAAVTQTSVTALFPKRLVTARLAEGLLADGVLNKAAMDRAIGAISRFCVISRENPTQYLFAYATSAVRDAKNGPAFCARVLSECGLSVDVLTGAEEARCAYLGAAGSKGGGVIDIGGGSAQVTTGSLAKSWPVGCVRAMELCRGMQKEEVPAAIARWMEETCTGLATLRQSAWTGVGGTVTTLAALQANLTVYDGGAASRETITPAGLQKLIVRLDEMGPARKNHPLLAERHDILPFGTLVLQELMRRLEIGELGVSDADGMEGYLSAQMQKHLRGPLRR